MSFHGLRVLTASDWMERYTARANCEMNYQMVMQSCWVMLRSYRGGEEKRSGKPVDCNPIMLRTSDAPLAFQQRHSFYGTSDGWLTNDEIGPTAKEPAADRSNSDLKSQKTAHAK
jgi:hypothetical protein